MSQSELPTSFFGRFESIRSRVRWAHYAKITCWVITIFLVGVSILAAIDYFQELPLSKRNMARLLGGLLLIAFALQALIAVARRWTREHTAAELERRFPELGQSIRTTVELSQCSPAELSDQGVDQSLVSALSTATDQATTGVPLQHLIPQRALLYSLLVAGVVATVAGATVYQNWEWRLAAWRALGSDAPYTTLKIAPGNLTVDQNDEVTLAVEVIGRPDQDVRLLTKSLVGESPTWQTHKLETEQLVTNEDRFQRYELPFTAVKHGFQYVAYVGKHKSEVHQVNVRTPLQIQEQNVRIIPPAYTLLPERVIATGNFQVVAGSQALVEYTLDGVPHTAKLVIRTLGTDEDEQEREIPLEIDGTTLRAKLSLEDDCSYRLFAKADNRLDLPPHRNRIRVREDKPPQIWFEEPEDSIDVHGLAEVLLRVRIRDDFGLKRAGIRFEVNNEQSYTLAPRDYAKLAEELRRTGGQITPKTRDAIEEILPLEVFELTQKDSVTYYAFAEDNYPHRVHYTETDLHFIDIRPFRRFYQIRETGTGGGGGGGNRPQVRGLQEIINRERFNLNRTLRLQRQIELDDIPSVVTVDRIARFQNDIALSTRETAEFLESQEFAGTDLLFRAADVMSDAVDSLGVGKYDIAALQEKDALRLMIETRNRVNVFLRNTATARQRNALARFNQARRQRIRQNQEDADNDAERAELLTERLRRLANEQEFVIKALTVPLDERNPQEKLEEKVPASPAEKPQEERDEPPADAAESSEVSYAERQPTYLIATFIDEDDELSNDQPADASEEPESQEVSPDQPEIDESTELESDDTEEETPVVNRDPRQVSPQEVEQIQQDLAVENRDIEVLLDQMRNVSDLARRRATDLADSTDQISGAIERGDRTEAIRLAAESVFKLNQLATHIEGITARNSSKKIAMARDIAAALAHMERQVSNEIRADRKPETTDEQRLRISQLSAHANRLSEAGKTMEDILDSVVETNARGDAEAVREVDRLLGEGEITETVERMVAVGVLITKQRNATATVEADDIADNLETAAQQLDRIFRLIVTPRIQGLRGMEGRVSRLGTALQQLKTQEQVTRWHNTADEIIEDLEEKNLGGPAVNALKQAMERQGWTPETRPSNWNWKQSDSSTLLAPEGYKTGTAKILKDLQERIQELFRLDIVNSQDEPSPPKYKPLIDRYIEVLTAGP